MTPIPTEPVHLVEDSVTGDRLLIYGTDKGIKIELRYDGDTLWMTQAQIAELFGRDVSTISRHINNIIDEGELTEESSLQKTQISTGRPAALYSLDMVISVGYRVSSAQATLFRRWATDKLVQFATKGFVIDAEQLKSPDARDRVAELKEIIRDIRSDEANVYRELRAICAMCSDYDGKSPVWHEFYAHTQAKLMYAVTTHTPSEMVISRANAGHENMGLRAWKGDHVTQADVDVSKNYLVESELREFNRLTVILLDIFEDQLDIGKLRTMAEVTALLDNQLRSLSRVVFRGGGSVKTSQAKAHAFEQYREFNEKRKAIRHAEADAAIALLKEQNKLLPKTPRKRNTT
ncbi:RhuM family protein [Tardiphaga sp. 841_E9_N1_2]|jgi:hypothetical protein|uniref:RhuM family protein n=1 Tax=Tardiphaga sp. 841_E9_N1_2 TaxID=3240762 RepID=UPI003F211F78